MKIEELKKEYKSQDNRGTVYPMCVWVQELVPVGVIADGFSPLGEDSEIRKEHDNDSCYDCDFYDDDSEKCSKEDCSNGHRVGYIWTNIQFFLTIKGAEDYIKADRHNHGKLRTYVDWIPYRNNEMRELLDELGFKTSD